MEEKAVRIIGIESYVVRLYHLIISGVTSAKSHQHDLDLVYNKSHAKRSIMRSPPYTQNSRHVRNSESRKKVFFRKSMPTAYSVLNGKT